MAIKTTKATRSHSRRLNRELVLRAIYTGQAVNRAALAQETGLTKPTVSDLVAELMDEGLVVEEGLGQSTEGGGKRPILLRFEPSARQVIGVSINLTHSMAVLTNLDGEVVAEHYASLEGTEPGEVFEVLTGVINGLVAQLDAPLLCLGVGISAVVRDERVLYAPQFGWHNIPLVEWLHGHFGVPVYLANSTELAAHAQFAFVQKATSLTAILIGNSIGVGSVLGDGSTHLGSEIGYLMAPSHVSLEQRLGWAAVQGRAKNLAARYNTPALADPDLSYLHIRAASDRGDPAALALMKELSEDIAQVFAWVIALMRPEHLVLAGSMANMGEEFLERVVEETCQLMLPELVESTVFSIDNTPNIVSLGAAARAIQFELGLV
jgi:N-acetylglucosamine repressor